MQAPLNIDDGHPDAKTAIGWSETRAETAMREAKRRLDAVLRRRESLVNVEGSSPASVERDDDSFSDADGGSHHALRANTRPIGDPRTNDDDDDDDYDADAGPFDDVKKRTPSRVGTRHDGFDPATPSIDSRGPRPLRRRRVGRRLALRRVRRAGDSQGPAQATRGSEGKGAAPWRRGSPAGTPLQGRRTFRLRLMCE